MHVDSFLLKLRDMASNQRQENEIDCLLYEVRKTERESRDARLEAKALKAELKQTSLDHEKAYQDGFAEGEASGFAEAVRIMEANGWIKGKESDDEG